MKPMNAYGKRGCPEHQQKIQEIGKNISKRGLIAVFEYAFNIVNGKKNRRFADVVGLTKTLEISEIHQVGKKNKDGRPVKRERTAIDDIESSPESNGLKVRFHTFAKVLIILITFGTLAYFCF